MRLKPENIFVAQPPMGGKVFLIDRVGLFVLERGPGVIITDACTHAGAGSVIISDGIPDDKGYFPEAVRPPEIDYKDPGAQAVLENWRDLYARRHGRELLRMSPTVMGSWMLNGGFHNGLTIEVSGGHEGIAPVATIVWMPWKGAAK